MTQQETQALTSGLELAKQEAEWLVKDIDRRIRQGKRNSYLLGTLVNNARMVTNIRQMRQMVK